jgi:hypothetical protein
MTIALILILLFLLFIWLTMPNYVKILTGSARVLTKQVEAKIKLNERLIADAKVYEVKRGFQGQDVDELVLFIPDGTALSRSIFIIDKQKRWLCLPNASDKDYQMLKGEILLQTKRGANFKVLATPNHNEKFKLSIADDRINFVHPLIFEIVMVSVELGS